MSLFKLHNSFEKRYAESNKVLKKYPDKVPVIVERATGRSELSLLDKQKFLVPSNITVAQLLYIIRQRLTLPSDKALFLFIANTLPTSSTSIGELYSRHVDPDGFLYVTYCSESTFG